MKLFLFTMLLIAAVFFLFALTLRFANAQQAPLDYCIDSRTMAVFYNLTFDNVAHNGTIYITCPNGCNNRTGSAFCIPIATVLPYCIDNRTLVIGGVQNYTCPNTCSNLTDNAQCDPPKTQQTFIFAGILAVA